MSEDGGNPGEQGGGCVSEGGGNLGEQGGGCVSEGGGNPGEQGGGCMSEYGARLLCTRQAAEATLTCANAVPRCCPGLRPCCLIASIARSGGRS